MSRLPTEAEFNGWKADPVTQSVVALFHKKREEMRQQWEGGAFTDWTKEGTVLTNQMNIGTCRGYAFFTDLSYDDFLTETDDAEQVRVKTAGSGSVD